MAGPQGLATDTTEKSTMDTSATSGSGPRTDDRARWEQTLTGALGIPAEVLEQLTGPILDMVRDVAHGVSRPSAPLTAFLVGLASGSASAAAGTLPAAEVMTRVEHVGRLVEAWEPSPGA